MNQKSWDAKRLGGSIKRGIVNPDLIEEREKLAFDRRELQRFSMGDFIYDMYEELD